LRAGCGFRATLNHETQATAHALSAWAECQL